MNKQKGIIHLLIPLLLLLVVGAGAFFLIRFGVIKNPLSRLPLSQQQPTVSVKSDYKNPFKKETQYINPFETYKNPFAIAK